MGNSMGNHGKRVGNRGNIMENMEIMIGKSMIFNGKYHLDMEKIMEIMIVTQFPNFFSGYFPIRNPFLDIDNECGYNNFINHSFGNGKHTT